MKLKREFLGWQQPAVDSAAEYLFNRYHSSGMVDLTEVTLVLPTRRSGRRLREVLLAQAESRELAFFPPQITTLGQFPELLYEPQRSFATPLLQQFAWAQALSRARKSTLEKVLSHGAMDRDDPRWFEFAGLLQRQHTELAGHGLDFADVVNRGEQLDGFTDASRWNALAKIQASYWKIIDGHGFWDRQKARNVAVDQQECHIETDVILLGIVDLTATVRAMLGQVAARVTALVYAPMTHADRFDEYGCVDAERWQGDLPVRDRHLLIAEGPGNQADAVVHAIDGFEGSYSAGELAIGVPDSSLIPHLENKLSLVGLKTRWGPGRSLSSSRPVQWLRIAVDYLASRRYGVLAELLRHSDTDAYLFHKGHRRDAISQLDRYFDRHLPGQLSAEGGSPGELPDEVESLQALLKPLFGKPRKPQAWAPVLEALLLEVYGDRPLDPTNVSDRQTIAACDQIQSAIERIAQLPEKLVTPVNAGHAMLMVLSEVGDEEIPEVAEPDAIEMLGWLDLPLDDAKAVIVTSMNDGVVPQAVSSDVLVPNRLRQELGLDDNARRYARDAYALTSLLESRMAVRLVLGRRQASGDPLRPSRLVMAVPKQQLAGRCLDLFHGRPNVPPITVPIQSETAVFEVPAPLPLPQPIDSLTVSDFNSYLACPYRFYLQKALRLRPVDDTINELDASKFGTLAHDVLEAFAKSQWRDSSVTEEIRGFLLEELRTRVAATYGRQPTASVQVQVAQLGLRLEAFAEKQAEWRLRGWQITDFVEHELPDGGVPLIVDGESIQLRGRIDRIDFHPDREVYAVLDYKTGEAGDDPERKHRKRVKSGEPVTPDHWVNLQLPLYRHLAKAMGLDRPLELGYVLLPSDPSQTKFHLASWSDEDLAIADEAAANVVRKIRKEVFWPPADPPPYPNDGLGAICQQNVFDRQLPEAGHE